MFRSLDPSSISVSSEGEAYYSRPGSLDVSCKFSGLVAFPRDNLTCAIEFGGWALSGGHQGIQLLNGGYEFSSQEATQGESYQEFGIIDVDVYTRTYEYAGYPSEPWPVVIYHVRLSRAYFFYFLMIVFPGMFVTVLSFLVFATDTAGADPLGYGIGIIVVVLLQNVVLIGLMPICGELLWNNIFWLVNTIFCCLSLFESAFCIMLEAHEEDHLLPLWTVEAASTLAWGVRAIYTAGMKQSAKTMPLVGRASEVVGQLSTTLVGGLWPSKASDFTDVPAEIRFTESVAGMLFRQMQTADAPHAVVSPLPRASSSRNVPHADRRQQHKGAAAIEHPPAVVQEAAAATASHATGGSTSFGRSSDDHTDAERLMYFERLFYQLDEDSSLFIDKSECEKLFSFALLHLSVEDRQQLFHAYDFNHADKLSRYEFVILCKDWLWTVPTRHLELAVENLTRSREGVKKRNRAHWTEVSRKVDQYCRVIIPLTYFFCMVIVFSIDLTDNYLITGPEESSAQMFSGLGPTSFDPQGYVWLAMLGIMSLLALAAMQKASKVAVERSSRARDLMIKLFVQNMRQMEDDGATYGLSPCVDRNGTLQDPEYDSNVGPLKRLSCSPFDAEPVRLGGSTPELLLRATRFVEEFHTSGVSVVGPSPLVDACHSAGVPRHALELKFSPFSRLNLPLAARKDAHIPIPAVGYAYVYPLGELAPLEESAKSALAKACGTAAALLLNGGYAYVDQAGVLLALNAVVPLQAHPPKSVAHEAAAPSCEPSFRLSGPFATTRLAYEELEDAGRYEPVVSTPVLTTGARRFAWIRNDEFGLHAPFGGFAFVPSPSGAQQPLGSPRTVPHVRGVYFALLPRNVPQATITVDLASITSGADGTRADADAASPTPGKLCLLYPLRSRVVEIKRGIEAQIALPVEAMRLWVGAQEMRDDLPLDEFGIANNDDVMVRVERKQHTGKGADVGEEEEAGKGISVSSLD